MRVEGRDDRGKPLVLRMMHRAADNRLMPGVKAVEIAERDDAAAQGALDAVVAVEADHGEVRRTRQKLKSASPSEDEGLCRAQRSEERRVGKECVRTCRSRGSRDHKKKKRQKKNRRK